MASNASAAIASTVARDASRLVHAPTEPGLGAHIDFDLIERKKMGVLS